MFKIVFETTKEYMNKRTCFAINGSSDGKVMPQGIFPDMSDYIVRLNYYMCDNNIVLLFSLPTQPQCTRA